MKPKKNLRQVAALPLTLDLGSIARVLLITSRETQRWIIPKGWPMKGLKDWDAAAIEARQEAGVLGKINKTPIGTYSYFKRFADHFELVEVVVYPLRVTKQLDHWREKGERDALWLSVAAAADRIDEPELAAMILDTDLTVYAKP